MVGEGDTHEKVIDETKSWGCAKKQSKKLSPNTYAKMVNEIFVRVCVSAKQKAKKQTHKLVKHIIRMCRSLVIMSKYLLCVSCCVSGVNN